MTFNTLLPIGMLALLEKFTGSMIAEDQLEQRSARCEKWDINGTWNVSFSSHLPETHEKQGFTPPSSSQKWDIGRRIERHGNETKMGHGVLHHSSILFRCNPPDGRIRSQIGPKHGDSCLGANHT